MAGTKRHIDQELKAKLGKHTLPVMDSDWTAFEGFRKKRESKRRRTLYFIAAASLLFIALSGALIWKSFDTPGLIHSENTEIQQTQKDEIKQAQETPTDKPIKSEEKGKVPTGTGTPGEPESKQSTDKGELADGETASSAKPGQDKPARDESNTPDVPVTPDAPETPEEADAYRFPVISLFRIDSRSFIIPSPIWKSAERPSVVAYKKDENQDTLTSPGKGKRLGFPPLSTPSIALGFVYGFGNPVLSVEPIDSSETHRGYENALQGSKKSSQVFRFFLQYEYRLKLGLEFGAGLEVSSATQVQNFNFQTWDIPVFDPDGKIVNYFPSQNPIPTQFESRQTVTSANVPVSVGYSHTFRGTNLRLGARARGSFGMNWSKGFNGLSPATLSETTLNANINPFNMSYGGGLFGEYFYLRTWSARVSLDWTAQNELYRKSNSYNINNRYYEFKLAIVKYL